MNENQTKKEKKAFYIIKLVQEDHENSPFFMIYTIFFPYKISSKYLMIYQYWWFNFDKLHKLFENYFCLRNTALFGNYYMET